MSNLLNINDIKFCTGILLEHFDTFSSGSDSYICIWKEPIKVLRTGSLNDTVYAGYSSNVEQDYDYIPVSGVFPAMFLYPSDEKQILVEDVNTYIPNQEIRMKVKGDARDFIQNGKTERIENNGMSFNIISTEGVQNYLGLLFYYYTVKRIN